MTARAFAAVALLAVAGCGSRGSGAVLPSSAPSFASPSPPTTEPRPPVTAAASPVATARPISPTSTAAFPAGEYLLPHYNSDSIPASQLVDVTVVDDGGPGCVWLEASDGTRIAALWPAGFRARFHPLRIYDGHDTLVWSATERHSVAGGYSPVYVERLPARCRTGPRAWWVGPIS